MDHFPYLNFFPELRNLVVKCLPRRSDRVALQRVCSVTHGDDPGPLSSLDPVPLVLAPEFRDFALRVMGAFIDADLDLRQPLLLEVEYTTEEGSRVVDWVWQTSRTHNAVLFKWPEGSTWRGEKTRDELRVVDTNDLHLLQREAWKMMPRWCDDGCYMWLHLVDPSDDRASHVRLSKHDTPVERRRPLVSVAAWTVQRRVNDRTRDLGYVFNSTAWHLAALEAEAQWIGCREIGPPITGL